MSELEYGINVSNKYDLLFGDEDPSEALTKAVEQKKKKQEEKPAPGKSAPAQKENKTRQSSGKAPTVDDGKSKERRIEGKGQRTEGGNRNGDRTRNVPGGQQQQQRSGPRSAGPGGPGGFGKENNAENRRPLNKDGQQKSPAAGGQSAGPRRFGGPRPEGGPRKPNDQEMGGPTGDQEVPEQRVGFGGNRGYRGGSHRGGRASPRHFGTRDAEPQNQHARGREFDRHSGSNKTGVKPVAKKEGGGAHNWGTFKDETEMGTETIEGEKKEQEPKEGETVAPKEGEAPTETVDAEAAEDAKKMTLKEWMEQQERDRTRPKYNVRAANDGEQEQKLFQKMKKVTKEKANADGMVEVVEYVEVDVDHPPGSGQKGGLGGPFQLVFSSKRGFGEGEEMRGERRDGDRREGGRGGRGGPRGGRGGPRGGGGFAGGRGGARGGRGHAEKPPAADELNFPPLG